MGKNLWKLIIFVFVFIMFGCSSYYIPIGSKTVDIKSYIYENDKLTEVEPLFEKIIYEYEKTENEPIIEFNEWKPKSLTHKGKLKIFWEDKLNYDTKSYTEPMFYNSIPEGWQIWFRTRYEKALDTRTGKELDLMIGGFHHSTNPNISLGRSNRAKGYLCYNRETKEILWNGTYGRYFLKNGLYGEISPYDQARTDINNGRVDWEIKRKSDEYKRLQFVNKSDNNLILVYANPSDDPKMGYDICSFDPVEDKIVKVATIPSAAKYFYMKNKVYYFVNKKEMYSVNVETYKTEYVGDFSQYVVFSNDYIRSNENPTLILTDHNGKGELLYNLETKKQSQYFNKIYSIENEEFDNNFYIVESGVYKGINPETFEFTWTFDEKEIRKESIEFDILLIDSRGILVRVGDEKIVGLKP